MDRFSGKTRTVIGIFSAYLQELEQIKYTEKSMINDVEKIIKCNDHYSYCGYDITFMLLHKIANRISSVKDINILHDFDNISTYTDEIILQMIHSSKMNEIKKYLMYKNPTHIINLACTEEIVEYIQTITQHTIPKSSTKIKIFESLAIHGIYKSDREDYQNSMNSLMEKLTNILGYKIDELHVRKQMIINAREQIEFNSTGDDRYKNFNTSVLDVLYEKISEVYSIFSSNKKREIHIYCNDISKRSHKIFCDIINIYKIMVKLSSEYSYGKSILDKLNITDQFTTQYEKRSQKISISQHVYINPERCNGIDSTAMRSIVAERDRRIISGWDSSIAEFHNKLVEGSNIIVSNEWKDVSESNVKCAIILDDIDSFDKLYKLKASHIINSAEFTECISRLCKIEKLEISYVMNTYNRKYSSDLEKKCKDTLGGLFTEYTELFRSYVGNYSITSTGMTNTFVEFKNTYINIIKTSIEYLHCRVVCGTTVTDGIILDAFTEEHIGKFAWDQNMTIRFSYQTDNTLFIGEGDGDTPRSYNTIFKEYVMLYYDKLNINDIVKNPNTLRSFYICDGSE